MFVFYYMGFFGGELDIMGYLIIYLVNFFIFYVG